MWEIKTADVRVFGWFYRQDQFIALVGDEAWRVKEYKLVRGYTDEVVKYREGLNLDEPKYVREKDPNYVVSNFLNPL